MFILSHALQAVLVLVVVGLVIGQFIAIADGALL